MEQERQGIAATLYTSDDVASEALALGFSAATSRVLPLIPLIQVAWADGSVSSAEERTVLEAAEQRGLVKGSESFALLHSLLVEQPPARFFERVNRVIAHMIADGTPPSTPSMSPSSAARWPRPPAASLASAAP